MATDFGITGWPPGEATRQVLVCFQSWIAGRGGTNVVHDESQMISQVRLYLERYGQSRFEMVAGHRVTVAGFGASSSSDPQVRERAGFRRSTQDGGIEFLCLPETFKQEISNGYNHETVLKALDKRGYLRRQGRGLTIKTTVANHSKDDIHFYCIKGSILNGVEEQD